jgi:hypothetical protein
MVTQNEEVQAEPQQEPAVVEPTGDVTPPVPEPVPDPVPEPEPEPVPAVAPVDQSAELARLQAQNAQYAQQAAVAEQQRQQQEQQNQLRGLQADRQRQLEANGWYPEQAAQEAATWAQLTLQNQNQAQKEAFNEQRAKGIVAKEIALDILSKHNVQIDANALLVYNNPTDMQNAARNMVAANGQIKQLNERIAQLEKAQQPAQGYDSGQGAAAGGYGSRDAVESAYIRGDINTDAYRKEMARYER